MAVELLCSAQAWLLGLLQSPAVQHTNTQTSFEFSCDPI